LREGKRREKLKRRERISREGYQKYLEVVGCSRYLLISHALFGRADKGKNFRPENHR
jgi:hypothetical protein